MYSEKLTLEKFRAKSFVSGGGGEGVHDPINLQSAIVAM